MQTMPSHTSSGLVPEVGFEFPTPTPQSPVHDRAHAVVVENAFIGNLWWAVSCRPDGPIAIQNLAMGIQAFAQSGEHLPAHLWRATGAVEVDLEQDLVAPAPPAKTVASVTGHARLARELREMTGLSAAALGSALGVSREQYQRWLAGGAISDARHGQLIYLHSIALDAQRRLGEDTARLWWKTPRLGGRTPADLVEKRQADSVYDLVASLPDGAPVIDGVIVGLPMRNELDVEDEIDDIDNEAWSPYTDDTRSS